MGFIFLIVGVVIVFYAMHLSGLAAESDFGPARNILAGTATSMYLFGVPALLFGGCLCLNVYMNREPSIRHEKLEPKGVLPVVTESHLSDSPASDSNRVTCPQCGSVLERELEIVKPDQSVLCGKCFKRFVPPE